MKEHRPQPCDTTMIVSLCAVCTEKVRPLPDGSWVHFGVGEPYEPMILDD